MKVIDNKDKDNIIIKLKHKELVLINEALRQLRNSMTNFYVKSINNNLFDEDEFNSYDDMDKRLRKMRKRIEHILSKYLPY